MDVGLISFSSSTFNRMTNEQQRIEIAKACGWEWHQTDGGGCYVTPDKMGSVREWHSLPDYTTDLNAMHHAEEVLTRGRMYEYFLNLPGRSHHDNIRATAAQRAEALLKTIGKWNDS